MCTYVRSGVVFTTQDVLFKDTYILAPICQGYSKSIIYAILVAVVRELYRNNDVQKSTVCTYVRSDIVLTTQDVLFKDTYIFLLQYVRATRKVSYMLYK